MHVGLTDMEGLYVKYVFKWTSQMKGQGWDSGGGAKKKQQQQQQQMIGNVPELKDTQVNCRNKEVEKDAKSSFPNWSAFDPTVAKIVLQLQNHLILILFLKERWQCFHNAPLVLQFLKIILSWPLKTILT